MAGPAVPRQPSPEALAAARWAREYIQARYGGTPLPAPGWYATGASRPGTSGKEGGTDA